MTITELKTILDSTGLPVAYYQFHNAPSVPFLVYWIPESDDVFADNQNYQARRSVQIELYADFKDFPLEARVEGVLKSNNLTFRKSEAYIESEHLHEVIYESEVLLNE